MELKVYTRPAAPERILGQYEFVGEDELTKAVDVALEHAALLELVGDSPPMLDGLKLAQLRDELLGLIRQYAGATSEL